jgi:hypothetical protein
MSSCGDYAGTTTWGLRRDTYVGTTPGQLRGDYAGTLTWGLRRDNYVGTTPGHLRGDYAGTLTWGLRRDNYGLLFCCKTRGLRISVYLF